VPEIDISTIEGVPIAIISGTQDILTTTDDTKWAMSQLGKSLVHYSEHELGHVSYFTAKDMSYFTQDVMEVMRRYHPIARKASFME
jgi:hypothetical protein